MDENINSMDNLTKYRQIMKRYYDGEFGNGNLSLYEILSRAGEIDLLGKMTLDEINALINDSCGISRELFVMVRNELTLRQENIKDEQKGMKK